MTPTIGVIGLLPAQQNAIGKEFSGAASVRFWNRGDAAGALQALSRACDVVFVHTKHVSHETVRNLTAQGARMQRVAGGMSTLRAVMHSYLEGHKL